MIQVQGEMSEFQSLVCLENNTEFR